MKSDTSQIISSDLSSQAKTEPWKEPCTGSLDGQPDIEQVENGQTQRLQGAAEASGDSGGRDRVELPFKIMARSDSYGYVKVMAVPKDGEEPVAIERYKPGDSTERRRVAGEWAADDRLIPEDEKVEPGIVAAELERQEAAVALQPVDTTAQPTGTPAASHVDDSVIVELAWNEENGGVDYIVYDRSLKSVRREDSVKTSRGVIEPVKFDGIVTPGGEILGCVRVPVKFDGDDIDSEKLRGDVTAFINRYVELPGEVLPIVVEYVFLTWVYDAFDEVPYLAFRKAEYGCGKSRALETVGALCYRPLFVGGGSTSAATLRMVDQFGGTLVADEFDRNRDTELASTLTKILNQGFQRNRPIVKCVGEDNAPRPFACFGPKIFASWNPFRDNATESRTLVVRMKPRTRDYIPLNLPRTQFDTEALALRNRLLAWRCTHLGEVRVDESLAAPRLSDRLNQIGLPLLSVAESENVREQIASALLTQQEAIAAELLETPAGEIYQVIAENYVPGDEIRPGKVAEKVNHRRAAEWRLDSSGLGVSRSLSPQRVGRILAHDLELPQADRDSDGARYRLTSEAWAQLQRRFEAGLSETAQSSQTSSAQDSSEPQLPEQPEPGLANVDSDDSDVS